MSFFYSFNFAPLEVLRYNGHFECFFASIFIFFSVDLFLDTSLLTVSEIPFHGCSYVYIVRSFLPLDLFILRLPSSRLFFYPLAMVIFSFAFLKIKMFLFGFCFVIRICISATNSCFLKYLTALYFFAFFTTCLCLLSYCVSFSLFIFGRPSCCFSSVLPANGRRSYSLVSQWQEELQSC